MTLLDKAILGKKFDRRLFESNVNRGYVSAQEATQHVNELPDESENAVWVSVEDISSGEEASSSSHAGGNSADPSEETPSYSMSPETAFESPSDAPEPPGESGGSSGMSFS